MNKRSDYVPGDVFTFEPGENKLRHDGQHRCICKLRYSYPGCVVVEVCYVDGESGGTDPAPARLYFSCIRRIRRLGLRDVAHEGLGAKRARRARVRRVRVASGADRAIVSNEQANALHMARRSGSIYLKSHRVADIAVIDIVISAINDHCD